MLNVPPVVLPARSLYPLILFDIAAAATMPSWIPSQNVALIALDMFDLNVLQFTINHVSAGEDFSLRAWVSEFPFGLSVLTSTPDYFPVVRNTPRSVYLTTDDQVIIDLAGIYAPVNHSRYFLNVQNLSNSPQAFMFNLIASA
jgi:hypothetical protein